MPFFPLTEASVEPKADSSNKPPLTARSTASILELLGGNKSWEEDDVPAKIPDVKSSEKENFTVCPQKDKPLSEKSEPNKSSEPVKSVMRLVFIHW